MTYRVKIIGINNSRQIEEMHLVCYMKFADNKCKHPLAKVNEVKEELETIVNKYFDLADISEAKPVTVYTNPI
jgi:hypothetical protein